MFAPFLKYMSVSVSGEIIHIEFHQFRKNEHQLAIILAHEMAHAILGHTVCSMTLLARNDLMIILDGKTILCSIDG